MIKKIVVGCFVVCLLLRLPPVQAQEGPPMSKEHGEIREIFDQLNLSDAQRRQLEANKRQHRAIMRQVHLGMREARQALKEELMKPEMDMVRIKALHERVKALMGQMEDNRLSSILEVRAILTPEQFARFINSMRRLRQEHKKQR